LDAQVGDKARRTGRVGKPGAYGGEQPQFPAQRLAQADVYYDIALIEKLRTGAAHLRHEVELIRCFHEPQEADYPFVLLRTEILVSHFPDQLQLTEFTADLHREE